jgi:hypothetical protein
MNVVCKYLHKIENRKIIEHAESQKIHQEHLNKVNAEIKKLEKSKAPGDVLEKLLQEKKP